MKALDEHLKFADECYSFVLEFAWDQHRRHPEVPRSEFITGQSLLNYLLRSGSDDAPVKIPLADQIAALADQVKTRQEMEALRSAVMKHVERIYPATFEPHPKYKPSMSLRVTQPAPELPKDYCIIHMTNALQPESFLNKPLYLIRNFRDILAEAENCFGCKVLYTASWMNSLPRWLAFFPDEWRQNLSEPYSEIHGNMGFLGQFLNAAGNLNRPVVDYLLITGQLKYPFRKSHCSIAAMRNHLKKLETQIEN